MNSFEKRLSENLIKANLNVKLGLKIHDHFWKFINHRLVWFLLFNKEYTGIKISTHKLLSIKSKVGKNHKIDLLTIRKRNSLQYHRHEHLFRKYVNNSKTMKL